MALTKRILLFLVTNIAVLILINIVLIVISKVFWIQVSWYGTDIVWLMVFSVVVWFSGAFISLLLSRWMAKKSYGIQLIDASRLWDYSSQERLVYETVFQIAQRNGISMPEVWFYQSEDANAFATGATKNKSLVAVSTGLMTHMNDKEIEGVVAHEMAHILNGDMVTMTLLQGVLNTFVVFASRIVANIADSYFSKWENNGPTYVYYIVSILFEIIFWILASIVVNAFSRRREFRADEGSAHYVGKDKMIAALKALEKIHEAPLVDQKFSAAMIRGREPSGFMKLFMSHPPLRARIEHLEKISF